MLDGEERALHLGGAEVGVVRELVLKLGAEGLVVAVGHDALLVEECEHARPLALDELDTLDVGLEDEVVVAPLDLLPLVLLDLEGEIELVEVPLELLVGIIDAKLLKVIGLEVLETKNIQDRDGPDLGRLLLQEGAVDSAYERIEHIAVERACQGVLGVHGLLPRLENGVGVA